ncbi:MAG: hypothetical protein Ct9H300mP14_02300 [Gammaproteobacteria bacterium]|nr:MAG: hypothetical protein Ct9H300mP14_02300 [Gammaproteobacteria bacterium]
MCGEMAGDPVFTRLLLGLGLREFSMEASSLPDIKQRILDSRIDELESFSRQSLDFSRQGIITTHGRTAQSHSRQTSMSNCARE